MFDKQILVTALSEIKNSKGRRYKSLPGNDCPRYLDKPLNKDKWDITWIAT